MNVSFTSHDFQRLKHAHIWDTEDPKQVQNDELHRGKATVWFAVQANAMVGPYYFNAERVEGQDYFHLLITYVWSEAYQFQWNAFSQLDGDLSYILRPASSLLKDIIPISSTGKYGLKRSLAKLTSWILLDGFPPGYDQVICTELSNNSSYLEKVDFSDECMFHSNGVVNKHFKRV